MILLVVNNRTLDKENGTWFSSFFFFFFTYVFYRKSVNERVGLTELPLVTG